MAGIGHMGRSKSTDWRGRAVSDYMSFLGASKVSLFHRKLERVHLGGGEGNKGYHIRSLPWEGQQFMRSKAEKC